jgi:hypothetical protein
MGRTISRVPMKRERVADGEGGGKSGDAPPRALGRSTFWGHSLCSLGAANMPTNRRRRLRPARPWDTSAISGRVFTPPPSAASAGGAIILDDSNVIERQHRLCHGTIQAAVPPLLQPPA